MCERKIPSVDQQPIIDPDDHENRSDEKIENNDENEKPVNKKSSSFVFQYASLPKHEITICYFVVIVSCAYGWYRLYLASRAFKWENRDGWSKYEDRELPFGLGTFRRDMTDSEWNLWPPFAYKILPWFIVHSVLFNFGEKICKNETVWKSIIFLNSFIAHCVVSSPLAVLITMTQGVLMYSLARRFKSKTIVWSVGACFIYLLHLPYFRIDTSDRYSNYIRAILFSYKMLQYMSYTTDMIDSYRENQPKSNSPLFASKSFLGGLWEMFWYAFYLPYSVHLIVIYKRFPDRLQQRRSSSNQPYDWWQVALFGLRIFFWYLVIELWLFVFYQQAIMDTPSELNKIRKDTLCAIGMTNAQFFHLKYVVIFGFPAFFARLDNMQPLQGPMCISRAVLPAKVWRSFDRGLYDFFKEYIFLPICRPTFSVWRKIIGLLISYAFVLLWHSARHRFVIWTLITISEILLESIAKSIYSIAAVRKWRETNISDRNFRRLLASVYWMPYAFTLFANFYFLGSSQSGWIFVDRIFWNEVMILGKPFILLITLCYFLEQVCIELEQQFHLGTIDGNKVRMKEKKN